ncbi:hypothetical protein F383_38182 [Gossypium arboreum]|uniref:Uncharacterized protein n=1 Tax=Gossypium arboreum TaxID=29729 RepID=A0A0B0MJD0_GOSAR|nr:hypothetical protein F383_38182 [Gossypium arboreum]
MGYGIGTPG